jgi:cobalt-zinc-cadmium efflux system outer membrane protein
MQRFIVALLGAACCASPVGAQTVPSNNVLTLEEALGLASANAPTLDAADAGVRAADAARRVAALRPNPVVSSDIENIGGSAAYNVIEAPKQTLSIGLPVELGGKRSARIAVANGKRERADIDQLTAMADLRQSITEAYVEAVAADRRLAAAQEQARIAAETVRAAQVRVEAGKASPLERQRADVLKIAADAGVGKAQRLAALAHDNLGRRLGRAVSGRLDETWFSRVDVYGPPRPLVSTSSLQVAGAAADRRTAEAQVRLARTQRIPDVTLSTGVRRLPATNSVAAVFGVSVPLPLFNNGSAGVAEAEADRDRAEALRKAAVLDADQAIGQAEVDLANAEASARTAAGPALDAAQEAARIARIGYREGKFGQLDLLEAERSLSETRLAAIDALAAYHDAQARLERLTTPAPAPKDDNR